MSSHVIVYYVCILYTCYFIVATNPVFRDFEKTFSGQIINPKDLIIKEQIGEGEYYRWI